MADNADLRQEVRRTYSQAAARPEDEHPFPMGRAFAESLGYPKEVLSSLPSIAVDAFTGVSNLSILADIPPGTRVLDLGCGAGLDSLIASQRAGPGGRIVGVDFSEAMLDRAFHAAESMGAPWIEFLLGEAEELPADDASVDVALVNGLFNLNPRRQEIFKELARVLRPNGVLYAAELVLKGPLPSHVKASESNWFA
ncbi:MAG: methyltransferase domain-containing protein [Chloroflexi bacterium]|nr:methyltransferase domain-containing protein [Chloroflexota bacterium]